MAYISVSGHKLFYEVQGQGNNSLIFIHGLCGDHRVWSKNIPAFTDDYRVVSIDMFGHGDSSKNISPQEALEAGPQVVESIIKEERLQDVVLVGHSIAGNILFSCIEQNINNVRGYVFVDCIFTASERVVNSRNRLVESFFKNNADQMNTAITNWYKTVMDMNAAPEDNELILSALKKINGKWVLGFLTTTNFVRKALRTRLPVLIFESNWLAEDEPERSFRGAFKHAEFSYWPILNHFSFVYEAQKFNQRLQEFLEKRVFSKKITNRYTKPSMG